jgi:hypothetical protein
MFQEAGRGPIRKVTMDVPGGSLLLALLLGIPVGPEEPKELTRPETTWRKAVGGFEAALVVTDAVDEFVGAWKQPAPERPALRPITSIHRGGNVASIIMFQGCRAGEAGRCDADVDFRLFRPDGSLYGEERVVLWKGKPAPPEEGLVLGFGAFGLRVEADDPLGTYTIEATVHDRVANIDVVLTRELRVQARP